MAGSIVIVVHCGRKAGAPTWPQTSNGRTRAEIAHRGTRLTKPGIPGNLAFERGQRCYASCCTSLASRTSTASDH